MRIGQGYDVHAFAKDRDLYLCGEKIEYELGLLGHSDADVALHAVCDALLGAAALGDIGKHFPDSDPKYKGISSVLLLEHVCTLVREKGFEIENVDVTIIAQKPKLLPYIPAMCENTARAMGIDTACVNVKATTTEKLGFEGRGEGISAMAVALLK
ncbi:MAG: 2-C-methyl-D-erythritol 2,4-cyclodiphosphate synthase [Clostridia bacterium]|nr:2-C-methyl-D-erythritol 2,4-cyclodiphosphate synthase [Clostridia bacterium]